MKKDRKLWDGIRVEVKKIFDAGQVYVYRVEMFSEKLTYELVGGAPYKSTLDNAEKLAVTIDAEFIVCGEIKRYSTRGEYYKNDKNDTDAEIVTKHEESASKL